MKLHRQLLEHDWLLDPERPEWLAAWTIFLLEGDRHDDGHLNLTTTRARRYFTESAWRHYLTKLETAGMIEPLTTKRHGGRRGSTTTSALENWGRYQGADEPDVASDQRRFKRRFNDGSSDGSTTVQRPDTDDETTPSTTVHAAVQRSDNDGSSDVQYQETTSSLRSEVVERREEAARAQDTLNQSSEAAFFEVTNARPNPHHERARVRGVLRRLAGPKFTERFENNLDPWTRWTNDDLRNLWAASNLENWPAEAATGKRRSFIFEDLLNEDRMPPQPDTRDPNDPYGTAYLHEAIKAALEGDIDRVNELLN